jgi:hypothetical protein
LSLSGKRFPLLAGEAQDLEAEELKTLTETLRANRTTLHFVGVEAHHRVGTAAVSGRAGRVGRVVLLLRRQRCKRVLIGKRFPLLAGEAQDLEAEELKTLTETLRANRGEGSTHRI